MEILSSYKEKLAAIQKLVESMDHGAIELSELSELEQLTRDIYERSIILRYKAFEQKVKPVAVEEEVVEEISEEVVEEPEEEATLDFSLFDDSKEPEMETIEEVEEISLEIEEPAIEQVEEEVNEEPTPVLETANTSSTSGFASSVKISAEDLSQFSVLKIDSLIGALSLNERLGFINQLFDGSSENFSEAIKKLDLFESMEDASSTIDTLANANLWDAEEESVKDFVIVLKRRYA